MNTVWIGSPNYMQGRNGTPVDRIVIHWMDGTLAGTDKTFQDDSRDTSAHFGVEDDNVHQYVDVDNTAYHAGNWPMNLRSVSIEHSAQPGRDASEKTYRTSAQIIREVCDKFGIPIDRQHIIKHSEVIPTACPGTIDIDKLIALAKGEECVMDRDDAIAYYWNTLHRRYDKGEVSDAELNGIIGKKFSDVAAKERESAEWLKGNDYWLNGGNRIKQLSDLTKTLATSTDLAKLNAAKAKAKEILNL